MFKRLTLRVITLLVLSLQLNANESNYVFRHLTIEDGLSNSNVNCIVQDHNGFIWIGTENGLNKYDGYKFTHYFSEINKENSLISNEIHTLMVDAYGELWVGTFQGLFKYNKQADNFEHIIYEDNIALRVNVPVYDLLNDTDGSVWIATGGRGLFKYDRKTNSSIVYNHSLDNKYSISSNFIYSIYKDKKNNLWIGSKDNGLDKFEIREGKFYNFKPPVALESTDNVAALLEIFQLDNKSLLIGTRGTGLFLFNIETNKFEKYHIQISGKNDIQPNEIYNIFRDSKQRLWIASHGNGLYRVLNNHDAIRLEHNANNITSLINNNVRTIFEDLQGNLWIVSYQGGINVLPNTLKKFNTYNLGGDEEYSSNIVTCLQPDRRKNLWVGTDGGGLKYIDRRNNKLVHYHPLSEKNKLINDKVVLALMLDKNNLWIGTYLKGLTVYDIKTKAITRYENTQEPNSISSNFISCFVKTKKGDIWVGTNGGGINRFDPTSKSFKRFTMDELATDNSLVNNYVNTIAEDNNGRLWIGTFWGLSVYDPLNGMFIQYLQNDVNGLSNNTIYSIKITSQNEIWLGTRNGLNKFMPATNSFLSFGLSEGLAGNVIYSIEEDNSGNLWLSTNNGICNFNTKTYETRNYYKSDGFFSNEFFRNASFSSQNGELLFGSLNGLVSFFPDSINVNYAVPKATLTKFSIFNQEIIPGVEVNNEVILVKPIYETDKIILKHKYNSFGFEFSALDYILPEKNIYKCMMEGFDKDWKILSSDQRYATYTNLDFGTYVFKVKASSIDNEWDNFSTNVTIVVKPPFYRTWWAYTIYYIVVMVSVIFFWLVSIRRVKLKNQIKLERVERSKSNEINQAKLRFFTNISHEFRTPLTLIIGPLQRLLTDKRLVTKYGDSINTMIKNANRLLRLVNQIMDIRKIEAGQMKLKTEYIDIIEFLKDIYNSFGEFAEQKRIDFRFLSDLNTLKGWFDTDKVDKIVFNLLSNAFKFTDESGEIVVVVEKIIDDSNNEHLKVSIMDTGHGIPEADLENIFDRFYQTKDIKQSYNIGSGVGLALTKSLIEQHYGQIIVKSEENIGTEFIVTFPLNEDAYADEEKFSTKVPGVNKYIRNTPDDVIQEEDVDIEIAKDKNQTILVVEDNFDLRKYIVNEFVEYYNIIEADNGNVGLDIALKELPDIIISDIVMPGMDGLDLCRKVKENFITNHIPVILLTARASIEHRIKGIELGADSYIAKPFNPGHLKVRVKKLLELRSVLKQKYTVELDPENMPEQVDEDAYLKEIKDLIIKDIDDPELNIEKICKEVGVSRAHLYRKIKLITDKSPTEYVRIIRLNEAAKLLRKSKKSISEICYMVGFNSPSYFSICFKEHFKVSPNDFMKKYNKPTNE